MGFSEQLLGGILEANVSPDPKGSKDPNNGASGQTAMQIRVFGTQSQYLGPWTLTVRCHRKWGKVDGEQVVASTKTLPNRNPPNPEMPTPYIFGSYRHPPSPFTPNTAQISSNVGFTWCLFWGKGVIPGCSIRSSDETLKPKPRYSEDPLR